MAQAGIYYEKNGYGEKTLSIYRVGLWFLSCALPLIKNNCHLSINQVSLISLLYIPRYGPHRHPL